MRLWTRSPALRFVLGGAALFALDAWRTRRAPRAGDIVVTAAQRDALRAGLRRERGREPSATELEARIAERVRDEALYRHALALGLERDDDIVRRRLVQKARYLIEAESEPPPPSDDEARAWLAAHPDPSAVARITLTHRFFSREPVGDAGLGEPFVRGERFVAATPAEVDGVFGEGFAARVRSTPSGRWGGPVRSVYGWHLVQWSEVIAPQGDQLERGRRGWRDEARARRVEERVREVVAGYRVLRR